ncbi:MAG: DUF4920 domain-containing protein [Planctomycetes bacterium]|nr:DUF4920 domain-containing protein [Planctomycetota bacterium]
MNTNLRTTLLLPLVLLAACHTTPTLPNGTAIGNEMKAQESYRFAVVDATPAKFFNKTVLVEATVKAVCQTKGCWMQVEDQGRSAMVRWETGCGGKFAFPKDAAGKRILIQGSFYPKTISEKDAKHLEEEAGGKLEIKREGYEFNASAVLVVDEQP